MNPTICASTRRGDAADIEHGEQQDEGPATNCRSPLARSRFMGRRLDAILGAMPIAAALLQAPESKMNRKLAQISFVVLGKDHNPTILNPDFLRIRGIVPGEWDWEVDATITTPALGFVRYTNGIVVSVEHEKLQVVDSQPGNFAETKAADIASRYVQTLPHVRYVAVGTNFFITADAEHPTRYVIGRFLKQGKWDSAAHPLETVGLRLVYPLPNGRIVVSLDLGGASHEQAEEGQRNLLIVNANFHRDCSSAYPTDAEVLSHLGRAEEDWASFNSLVQDVVDTE